MSFLTIGSVKRRPTRRLMAKNVISGLVTAWRFADWTTRRSPDSVKATMEGVVRTPSPFSITLAFLPSITATQEFVVPRSIPMTLLMDTSLQKQDRTARGSTVPIPREVIDQSSPDCGWGLYMWGLRSLQPVRTHRLGRAQATVSADSTGSSGLGVFLATPTLAGRNRGAGKTHPGCSTSMIVPARLPDRSASKIA